LYLSKLEILGFKSFSQKTVIVFNEGVTSIVGPNGCGKTNIVDAIRWCLGEQKSTALRSDKMENVIFNGTSTKKPMGMAEVSLSIKNTKGILPTEYTDVTITRRIFRSGESEYLLNKNICRLKDITNLFMDTGIGANAYSVIELKMVETILSSKAEERRTMFEEAAGVNKYKLRRRLALRKLDEVKADLVRVNDIVTEVEKKVNSLERQAKKANRYNKISASLRELEIDFAEREMALLNVKKEEARLRKEEYFTKKIDTESQLSKLEDEAQGIKQNLFVIEKQLEDQRNDLNLLTEKIYGIQQSISLEEERKKFLSENIDRYQLELDELKQHLHDSQRLIEEGAASVKSLENDILSKEAVLNLKMQEVKELKNQHEEKRSSLKLLSDFILIKFKEIANFENNVSGVQNSLDEKNRSIARLNEKILLFTNNIAKTVGFIEELNREKNETAKKLEESESFFVKKQKEKDDLENELNRLREKELEEKGIANALKDKINFVQGLIENLEGVSKGAKTLLENDEWLQNSGVSANLHGRRILLAHAGSTADEYRFAVEASIKNNLNSILVESLEDLKNGIQFLKNNEAGKASFYLMQEPGYGGKGFINKLREFGEKRKIKRLGNEEGFIGWAKDLIACDNKWKSFFDWRLRKTAIVDSFETALRLSERYSGFNFTSLNGDYIDSLGVIEAGSAPKADDSLFGRKEFLEGLKYEYIRRKDEFEKIKDVVEETEEKINKIDLKNISEEARLLVNDIANVEKQIALFEYEKKKAADEIEKARQEIQELANEANRTDDRLNGYKVDLEKMKNGKLEADRKLQDLEAEFSALENKLNSETAGQNNLVLEKERLFSELRNTESAVKHAENSIENINKTISRRENDILFSTEEINNINHLLSEKNKELNNLEADKQSKLKQFSEIEEKYNSIKSEIAGIENKHENLRDEKETVVEEIHRCEMKLGEYEIKISNLIDHIKDSYSLTLSNKAFDDLDSFDFKQKEEEVQLLKQQIKNLGPINLLAYSEFEEEKERFEFLSRQRNDLIESEKDIVKTIDEINVTAQRQFMETFEKIRENFVKIFRGLFNPGDEADLRLEESSDGILDPLEAKIEIVAKPKGKRPTSIELLSGGEKTLTAIALLFAIYLVKPSPFCILDEIDAPLDDANIDRFTKILADFSSDTQFIVVTHNKRTMEAADTLYGVTMQEEGISKLVSVRFNEDLNVAAG